VTLRIIPENFIFSFLFVFSSGLLHRLIALFVATLTIAAGFHISQPHLFIAILLRCPSMRRFLFPFFVQVATMSRVKEEAVEDELVADAEGNEQ